MKVDFKVTAWERVDIHPDAEEEVLKALKEGKIKTANDLWDYAEDHHLYFEGILHETEVQMTLYENDGFSTIEAIDDTVTSLDEERTLYQNGKG